MSFSLRNGSAGTSGKLLIRIYLCQFIDNESLANDLNSRFGAHGFVLPWQLTARMSKTKTLRFIVQAQCKQAEGKQCSTHPETVLMKKL